MVPNDPKGSRKRVTKEATAMTRQRVRFVYTGNSSLTVTGIVSGKRYTFTRPGDVVEVDERDRVMLLAMPSLKRL
ncbi:MAG: hypothetical protein C4326_11325 [Ignavibacteria bacterium]